MLALKPHRGPGHAFVGVSCKVRQHRTRTFCAASLHPSMAWVKKTAGYIAAGTGLFIAVFPSIVSTKLGLAGSKAVLSHVLPGKVEVEELSMGWREPVRIAGLRLHDSPSKGDRILVEVSRLDTNEGLWSIITGQQVQVTIAKPVVDLTVDDGVEELRVLRYLKQAGLVKGERSQGKVAAEDVQNAGSASKSRWMATLTEATTAIDFTADVRLLNAEVYVADGKLAVPEDIRQILGSRIHGMAVLGQSQLQRSADDLGLDSSWVNEQQPPEGNRGPTQPGMASVLSEHITMQAAGWKCADDTFVLREPARVDLDFHPALARYGLSKAAPILADVVGTQGRSQLHVSFFPDGGRLPFKTADVALEPAQLLLSRGSLLEQLLKALRLESFGRDVRVWTSPLHCQVTAGGALTTQRVDMQIGSSGQGVQLALWGSADPDSRRLDMHVAVPHTTLATMGFRNLPDDFTLTLKLQGTMDNPSLDWREVTQKLASLTLLNRSLDQRAPADGERVLLETSPGEEGVGPIRTVVRRLLGRGRQAIADHVAGSEFLQGGMDTLRSESAQVPPPGPLPWLASK